MTGGGNGGLPPPPPPPPLLMDGGVQTPDMQTVSFFSVVSLSLTYSFISISVGKEMCRHRAIQNFPWLHVELENCLSFSANIKFNYENDSLTFSLILASILSDCIGH